MREDLVGDLRNCADLKLFGSEFHKFNIRIQA